MDKYYSLVLVNVGIKVNEFAFNDSIKIKKLTDKSSLLSINHRLGGDTYEGSPLLIYRAFQLALSNINIIIKRDKENEDEFLYNYFKSSGSELMNYYASKDLETVTRSGESILNKDDLERIKDVHSIVVEYNRTHGDYKVRGNWKPTRWSYANEQYLSACRAMTIDQGVLSLITGLESLLVKGEGLLKFKVSLYASIILEDTIEKRRLINKQVNFMYNLRSKIVHGEIENVVKITSKPEIFDRYFELKDILGRLLIKTYGIEETDLFNRLDEILYEVPKF